MVESLVTWERDLFLLLNGSGSTYLDGVMYLISDKWPWVIFLLIFLFITAYRQKRQEWLTFLLFVVILVIVADGISSGIIKPIFQRFRPTHHPVTRDLVQTVLGYEGGNYGFISGHSTNFLAFATFTALVFKNKWYSLIALITALTVAYSRIYLGVHFITDVVPGVIVGVIIGTLVYLLYAQGRTLFLGVSKEEVKKRSYLRPLGWSNYLALLMALFYIGFWVLSPLVIKLY